MNPRTLRALKTLLAIGRALVLIALGIVAGFSLYPVLFLDQPWMFPWPVLPRALVALASLWLLIAVERWVDQLAGHDASDRSTMDRG